MLLAEDAGRLEAEGALERTWRVGQDEIVRAAGLEAARGRREWVLDGGPYRARYTRNGRCALRRLVRVFFVMGVEGCVCSM